MSENKDYVTKEDYKELKKKFREERKQEKKQNRVDKKIEKIENKLAALRGEEGELKEEKKEEYHPVEEKREEHHHPVEEKKVYYAYRKREGDDDKGKYYAYREQPGITRRVTIRPANYVIVDKKDADTVSSTNSTETEKQSDLSDEIPKGKKISVPLPFDSNDDASPGFAPENEPERVPLSDPAPNEPIPEREPKY